MLGATTRLFQVAPQPPRPAPTIGTVTALTTHHASLTWLSAVGEAAGAPPPVAGMLLLMLSWLTVGDCVKGERGLRLQR